MQANHLAQVLGIEQQVHAHPWTLRHFQDSLTAGHWAWVLPSAGLQPTLVGYVLAMPILDELHVLNLSVAPTHQRQGLGLHLLQHLQHLAVQHHMSSLWLEVRTSNVAAQSLYVKHGFDGVGLRRQYYPNRDGTREDARIMCLRLETAPTAAAPIAT
jgi:[ribosomal protein S18]-alanine N-acetyltransferase